MARKREEPVVQKVIYTYVGTNNQFNIFLRAVVYDYLSTEYSLEKTENPFIAL